MRFLFVVVAFLGFAQVGSADQLQVRDGGISYTEKIIFAENVKSLSIVAVAEIMKDCNFGGFSAQAEAIQDEDQTYVLQPTFINLLMGCGNAGHKATVRSAPISFEAKMDTSSKSGTVMIRLLVPSFIKLEITEVKN
jgi:hypothetical protein